MEMCQFSYVDSTQGRRSYPDIDGERESSCRVLHCLVFNPRRLILQAKVGGKLFSHHLNRRFFKSSSLPQILAGIMMHENPYKGEPIFFPRDPMLPIVWSSTKFAVGIRVFAARVVSA